MNGEIGVLYQNKKQVGGIYDWDIDAAIGNSQKNKWRVVTAFKHITAKSYWLTDTPDGNTFEAEFYQQIGDRLVLIDTGTISVKLPSIELDKRIPALLRLRWMS